MYSVADAVAVTFITMTLCRGIQNGGRSGREIRRGLKNCCLVVLTR